MKTGWGDDHYDLLTPDDQTTKIRIARKARRELSKAQIKKKQEQVFNQVTKEIDL